MRLYSFVVPPPRTLCENILDAVHSSGLGLTCHICCLEEVFILDLMSGNRGGDKYFIFKWEVKYFQNIFHWIELLKIFLHYALDILPAHRGTRKPRSLSAAARRRPRARRWRGTGSGGCAPRVGRRSGYLHYIVHNKNIRWWDNAIIISAVWCWVGSDKLNWTWLIGFCLIL